MTTRPPRAQAAVNQAVAAACEGPFGSAAAPAAVVAAGEVHTPLSSIQAIGDAYGSHASAMPAGATR